MKLLYILSVLHFSIRVRNMNMYALKTPYMQLKKLIFLFERKLVDKNECFRKMGKFEKCRFEILVN